MKLKELFYLEVHHPLQKKFSKYTTKDFFKNIPILGVCYGLQLIAKLFGGRIKSSKKKREFGRAVILKKIILY